MKVGPIEVANNYNITCEMVRKICDGEIGLQNFVTVVFSFEPSILKPNFEKNNLAFLFNSIKMIW